MGWSTTIIKKDGSLITLRADSQWHLKLKKHREVQRLRSQIAQTTPIWNDAKPLNFTIGLKVNPKKYIKRDLE